MLQILAVGVLIQIVSNSYDPILYAKGDTFALFGFAGIALVLGVAGGLIGAQSAGMYGLLIGTTISQWLVYLVKANYFAKRSLWQREIDLPCLGIATLLAAVIFAANSSGSSGLP